jgi:hypothetical protein
MRSSNYCHLHHLLLSPGSLLSWSPWTPLLGHLQQREAISRCIVRMRRAMDCLCELVVHRKENIANEAQTRHLCEQVQLFKWDFLPQFLHCLVQHCRRASVVHSPCLNRVIVESRHKLAYDLVVDRPHRPHHTTKSGELDRCINSS